MTQCHRIGRLEKEWLRINRGCGFVQHGAHAFAQAAVYTHVGIGMGVVEALAVCPKADAPTWASLNACLASTTFFLARNLNHEKFVDCYWFAKLLRKDKKTNLNTYIF